MAWINGFERKRFDEDQKRLAEEYRIAGMTNEQIEQMYQFDLETFNSRRRFTEHTQQFPECVLDESSDDKSPLFEKYLTQLSIEAEKPFANDRYGWIESIDNPDLAKAMKSLSIEEIELITLFVFEEYTQTEIAKIMGLNQSTICRRLEAKKKFLKNFLKHA